MEKRYYRSVFDDLEDIRNFNEWLIRQIDGTCPVALLPAPGGPGIRMLPQQQTALSPEVSEKEEEVVVTLGMPPGIRKNDLEIHLVDSRTLEILFGRRGERTEEGGGYFLHEQSFSSGIRVISLPAAVVSRGSSASFRNRVLEIRLKKTADGNRIKILID